MKGLIFLGVLIAALLIVALNPRVLADQVVSWVKQNPDYASAPELLLDTGNVCKFLQADDTAIEVYNDLYQQYPKQAAFCAEALYDCGKIKADSSYLKGVRVQALPYLQIILDQYPDQVDWVLKAQQLMNEVNGAH
jgi:hypothetical protein